MIETFGFYDLIQDLWDQRNSDFTNILQGTPILLKIILTRMKKKLCSDNYGHKTSSIMISHESLYLLFITGFYSLLKIHLNRIKIIDF